MTDIDYKTLLKKYMEHVGQAEGSLLLEDREAYPDFPIFTDEEYAELQRLEHEPYLGPRVDDPPTTPSGELYADDRVIGNFTLISVKPEGMQVEYELNDLGRELLGLPPKDKR